MSIGRIVVALLFTVPALLTASQQPPKIGSGTTAVVVDVIVRDAKGNPVTDLRKQDFELLEDGVRQEVADVALAGSAARAQDNATAARSGASEAEKSSTRPAPGPPAAITPGFLALVFDRLSLDARVLAYKGALAAVDSLQDGDFAAVYLSDLSLTTIQPYTNDREKLRTALKDVASRPTAVFDRTATRDPSKSESLGDSHESVPVVASAEFVGRPVDTRGASPEQHAAPDVSLGTSGLWEIMARDQQGYATTNALLAVTAALAAVPGRKTVVFFAEGLAIPDAVLPHFRNVVTTANRGNVSVYTIDAAGLRVHSKDAETGREVRAMGNAGISLSPTGENLSNLAMMEHNEDVLRRDPRTSLTLLADQTGGFLVDSTNDLAKAFRQIDADRRSYYLLTYTPRKPELDGTWRTIAVKVPNRRVTVRARSGYLAVRAPAAMPLLTYEGPALAALDRSPAPNALPLRTTALVFPEGTQSRVVVLAATDASALRFEADGKAYRTDFTILARLTSANGEVVRKASQPYRLGGPVDQMEQARRGEVLFFRQPTLPPGSYTLEVAVHDALAGRSGVSRARLIVPASAPQSLQVSDLMLVQRAERVKPEERNPDNPLYVGNLLVYPNLGSPIRKSRQKTIAFYVVVTPAAGSAPHASLEVLGDGRTLAQLPVVLAAADTMGRIPQIAQLPIETLPPGSYTLRLTVTQGDKRELRAAVFELVE